MAVRVLAVLAVLMVLGGISGRVVQASEVSSQQFMDHLMSMNGCGRFAGLVNATVNATKILHGSLVHGGLVLFCPDDDAVAAFEPSFNDLCADGHLAVLLYHGVAPASLKDRRTRALTVPTATLATDLANWGYGLTIHHRGDTMQLSSSSGGVARVTRTVTDEEVSLVVYLIDAVLLPKETIECGDISFDEGQNYWLDVLTQVIVGIWLLIVGVVGFIVVLWLGLAIYYMVLSSLRAP